MRLELGGSLASLIPIILRYTENGAFVKASYVTAGYTNVDVMVIGAGGGRGGNADGTEPEHSYHIKNFGGQGGGGGYRRFQGVLEVLPSSVDIVIGGPGADGTDTGDPDTTTDGGDGGTSSFGGTTFAYASGGKGGARASTLSWTDPPGGDGGDGGSGEHSDPGHGGAGGLAGTFSGLGAVLGGFPGEDGTLRGFYGNGGGGGAGGMAKYDTSPVTRLYGTQGGKGAYDFADQSVFGPSGLSFTDPDSGALSVGPGKASGARVTPLDGSGTIYGQSGQPGIVVIRLTAE
jgi:hypothetical protein